MQNNEKDVSVGASPGAGQVTGIQNAPSEAPSVNATVASNVYPEPTKGFLGSVATPKNTENDAVASKGAMLLYVTAFTISTALVLSIVASIAGLLEVIFNHIGSTDSAGSSAYFGLDSYVLKTILWLVSSLVISTVLYIGLLFYMKKNESVVLNSFSTKVYGFIYGSFLTIVGLAAIASFSNFVYSCLVPLVPKGAYDGSGVSWWVGIVQALTTTLLLGFVLFYYFNKAKNSNRLS